MNTTMETYTAQEQQVLAVFNRHVASFTSGNLDAVLNDFAEDSVVITPDGAFEGRAQIRELYKGLLEEFGVIDRGDSPGFSIDALHLRNDTLLISWRAESTRHLFRFGTDTFVCSGGKFVRQSIAFPSPEPKVGHEKR